MGVLATVDGGDFSARNIGAVPVIPGGLEFMGRYGGSVAKTGRNLVAGKPAPFVVGNPTIAPNYAVFTARTHYVQTLLFDQIDVTHLAVVQIDDVNEGGFAFAIGNYEGAGVLGGSSLCLGGSPLLRVANIHSRGASGSESVAQIYGPDPADQTIWAFIVTRIGATTQKVDDKTRKQSGGGTTATVRSTTSKQLYRIGSGGASSGNRKIRMSLAMIYSRLLSDAEIDAIYKAEQVTQALQGITI